jgi:hypothetical protein
LGKFKNSKREIKRRKSGMSDAYWDGKVKYQKLTTTKQNPDKKNWKLWYITCPCCNVQIPVVITSEGIAVPEIDHDKYEKINKMGEK